MQFRYLALGAVTLLALASRAHAEDAIVPDEFEQQERVRACDAHGAGFAKLPGTNTCVKVSGQMRYEKRFLSLPGRSGGQMTLDFETRSD